MELSLQDKLRLIEFFEFLLDEEISKPLGQMNSEAVDNYVEILLDLQDKQVELSQKYIDEQVRKIFHPEDSTVPEAVKTTKKYFNKKKVWLVAACIAILVALFSFISVAYDWNVFDFLTEKFGSVHSAPVGEEQDFNGISLNRYDETRTYKTLKEAFETEKLYVLHPSRLPDDISVNEILVYKENEEDKLVYIFNKSDLNAEVIFNTPLKDSVYEDATEIFTIDSITYYVCSMPDISLTQIEFEHNGNSYFFSHTDKDILIKIVENLEEINYED